nr:ulp1 protease family, C-terminal catalytic domain-containing protein [Ipomoea batatas]GME02931.1 ulp1 protease family, C-terminal catalytic domain-containing protein [Ipomoea batatas]
MVLRFGKKPKATHSNTSASGVSNDDDDFVALPLASRNSRPRLQQHRVGNAPNFVLTTEDATRFPQVKTRALSTVLVDALKNLSSQQKFGIRELDFGALLELKVDDTPLRILHWLLSNFDP